MGESGPRRTQVQRRKGLPAGRLFVCALQCSTRLSKTGMESDRESTVVMTIAFLFILVLVGLLIIQEPMAVGR